MLKKSSRLALAGLLAAWLPMHGALAAIVDQVSPFIGASINAGATVFVWQQEVRAGLTGALQGVDLHYDGTTELDFRLFINRGSGWQTDADDCSLLLRQHPSHSTHTRKPQPMPGPRSRPRPRARRCT